MKVYRLGWFGTAGHWRRLLLGGWRGWRTHLGAASSRAGGFGAGGAASSAGLGWIRHCFSLDLDLRSLPASGCCGRDSERTIFLFAVLDVHLHGFSCTELEMSLSDS